MAILTTIGAAYAPANKNLAVNVVEKKVSGSDTRVGAVAGPEKLWDDVVDERQQVYGDVDDTVDLVIDNLEACDGVSAKTIKTAKAVGRKIKGTNKPKKKKGGKQNKAEGADPTKAEEAPNSISTSHQSYDMVFTNFKELVAIVKSEANYVTNEPAAKVANLELKVAAMEAVNKKMKPIEIAYKKTLEERDIELYYPETGLLDLMKKVKKAVSGTKAISASEKEAVKNIKFKAPSKKNLHFEWPNKVG